MACRYVKLQDIELKPMKSFIIFENLDKNKIPEDAIFVTIKPFEILEFGSSDCFNSNIIQLSLKKLGKITFVESNLPYLFEASQYDNKSRQYIDRISKPIDRNEAIAICRKMVGISKRVYDANLHDIICR